MSKTYTWHKIADDISALSFSPEGMVSVEVAGKDICLIKFKEELFVCTSKCPHAGGDMAQGYTDVQGNIVCPVHGYKFSLATGRNTSGEGFYLKTYPVEKRADGIYIGTEDKTHSGG